MDGAHAYRETAPGAALATAVECFWSSAAPAPEAPHLHRVLPDGCMDILFDFRPGARAPVTVVGTMSRALVVEHRAATDLFGIRFRAGGLPALLGLDAAELRDGDADLGCFTGSTARQWWERLAEAPAEARAALAARLIAPPPVDPLVAWCAARIESAAGALPVAALEQDSGVNARRIERRFASAVGIGPKMFARVTRFRALVAAAEARQGSWADLAAAFGYADQPHMVREFRAFAGISPTEYLAPRDVGFVQDLPRAAA